MNGKGSREDVVLNRKRKTATNIQLNQSKGGEFKKRRRT